MDRTNTNDAEFYRRKANEALEAALDLEQAFKDTESGQLYVKMFLIDAEIFECQARLEELLRAEL